MLKFLPSKKHNVLLWVSILVYVVYFSIFTVLRMRNTLYASYYDLGIMHQTVYSTYKALQTGDYGRFLELTNPTGIAQIKRMAIHNDLLLALIAPFYFIHSGPETLLVIQSFILGLGALAVFKISQYILQKLQYANVLSLGFAFSYLLYPPLQLSNIYDFHAVTLATVFLLFMFYFWLVRRYWLSLGFLLLSLLSKEQVGLVTLIFGIYLYASMLRSTVAKNKQKKNIVFASVIIVLSVVWFILSVFYLIPIFRGGQHFAVARYTEFGDSPIEIIIGILTNPYSIAKIIFSKATWDYLVKLLAPVGFLPLLSPAQLLLALPEFAVNLLSKNPNMRNIIYHYTAVITPFVFISAIYGGRKLIELKSQISKSKTEKRKSSMVLTYLLIFALYSAYIYGPLPFAKNKNTRPLFYKQSEINDLALWERTLKDENLKISTTGQLSPFFTSRRYFYTFSPRYYLADYVLLRLNEVFEYPEKDELIPVYQRLRNDQNFELIYKRENFEVYKKKVKS
ncbi:hypothetical protein A2774_00930 [Candidatus Roizmanbacteria bacterium RIFCSPHIGHO2_01_FULL_39_12c]|uniref:DUF2079 domain-containing protein n=1 Tax=Candidatus Roizmanbacteria bacterium RIFCSPHIGHO2_01_FULL_39_12c TaxID=1802031 RepID=A0A1F7GF69_9BACT|nr:MAG: hypothetical protein A2774_00930 [Candidatus Roizmanbacteria bacterium RIFCSPHIGHO2_01_FULL_39_12c]OGK46554.1 MAG: hypothetical protein A2963_02345 [Candidatus Roizmanbacteria bacterium RIFCSPLOWO2_01_FULL_40_13]